MKTSKARVAPWLALLGLAAAGVLTTPRMVQGREIFTATAGDGDGPDGRAVTVTFVVERYSSDAEHASALAALKEGAPALQALLAGFPDIGRIIVAGKTVPLKYAYTRPQSIGRITLLANEPLAFLGAGSEDDRARSGFDYTLAILDFSLPGFGAGEIDPAVKLSINSAGQIVTEEYGAAVVRLSDLRRQD